MTDGTEVRNVREIFEDQYVVPVYQRAYAWGDDEIGQLLQDIRDARLKGALRPGHASDYYIGTLVVHRADAASAAFEVVDGQQRLTTLALLLSHPAVRAHLPHGNSAAEHLTFEGRPNSQKDLADVASYPKDVFAVNPPRTLRDEGLRGGVAVISTHLRSSGVPDGSEVTFEEDDFLFLLEHVRIVRTELPQGTDLNHYFEIMNSRGEQLEKHEIVKARLLHALADDPDAGSAFSTIWDACSDLSRFVQQGFPKDVRNHLFGHSWDSLTVQDPDILLTAVMPAASDATLGEMATFADLVDVPVTGTMSESEEEAGRYGAIIDFPNLLLQVLRLHVTHGSGPGSATPTFTWGSADGSVPLDDKRLIVQFAMHITSAADAKQFIHTLLTVRFLFDNYVIKTDKIHDSTEDDSNWVLRRPHRTNEGPKGKLSPRDTFGKAAEGTSSQPAHEALPEGSQRRALLLQSMFQVTDSRRSYKNFLYAIIENLWLSHSDGSVNGEELISLLEHLASDRARRLLAGGSDAVLHTGTGVPHFLFNYLDYLLWRRGTEHHPALAGTIDKYVFRYRKSIEHFYPVQPDENDGHKQLSPEVVNRFGNLCTMSSSENSRRNNLVAVAKATQFRSDNQSLKFQLMAAITREQHGWGRDQIHQHGAEMIDVLASGVRASGSVG